MSAASAMSPEPAWMVLLVDDCETSRQLVASDLESAGCRVVAAPDGDRGWEFFQKHRFDLVISDLRMPKSDGMALLRRIRSRESHSPQVPVILLSAYGTLSLATAAGKAGVTDFFPLDQAGIAQLLVRVEEILGRGRRRELPDVLVGESREITSFRERLRALAGLEAPLLLVGEPGTRRWSVAMLLHHWSRLAHQPLTRICCGAEAAPSGSLPSGTLYLEDVELLSKEEQRCWLGHIRSLQLSAPSSANRIIATTSQELVGLAEEAKFDTDLAAELSRFTARIPPLRERVEDLRAIAETLLSRVGARLGRRPQRLTDGASARLEAHPWHENLAELERVLEWLAAYTVGDEITRALVEEVLQELEAPLSRIAAQRSRSERRLLLELYEKHGSYTGVAQELGITRNAAKYRLRKHGLLPLRPPAPGARPRAPR